ncbi:MAG: PD40 domain-containing protein [Bacteroidia bacterium]|nr:PD40 domain-containing protein [Bacteroidia bacterium]
MQKILKGTFYSVCFLLLSISVSAQTFKAFVNAGEQALQNGDYYAASEYFMKALEFENDDLNVKYKMAEASRLFNDVNVAAYWYNQTILKDHDNRYPLALFHLAMMNKMKGEYETAKNLFFRYYSKHAADSDYYAVRARKEITGCEEAYQLTQRALPVEIKNMGNSINTVYSDFGGIIPGDSVLYFSSLRFEVTDEKTKKPLSYLTRILKSSFLNNKRNMPLPLDTSINSVDLHTANVTFSSDRKWMVFTRCTSLTKSDMRCELFASRNVNGQWQRPFRLPDSINLKEFTVTQPSLAARGADGYTLYFVSDKKDGFGKLDIWKSEMTTNGEFSSPVNLGSTINTDENEITPFFNDYTQTLYFSSDRAEGLGGYDIFYASVAGNDFSTPVNAGFPLNSSYHDLYFTTSPDEDKGIITSNRQGSLFIKSKTCCYDLWEYEVLKKQPPVLDTLLVLDGTKEEYKKDTPKIKEARSLLPLVLYFDNDHPDPRTLKTETRFAYDELYNNYIGRKQEYLREFSKGLDEKRKQSAETAIQLLFNQTIIPAYMKLDSVARLLSDELNEGKKIRLVVRGQASPLASARYNDNLSRRRISSLVNYLMRYGDKSLADFEKKGSLVIEWKPVGKSMAPASVSDDLKDLRNSVYSPAAALERKIEVIDVIVE